MNVDKCQIEFERTQTQRATGGKQVNMVYCQYENDIISYTAEPAIKNPSRAREG